MIDDLTLGRSAHFHRVARRLSAAAINRLFAEIRDRAQAPSNDVFRLVRRNTDHGLLSGICFSHDRVPTFLAPELGRRDRVHGYLLLLERVGHVAVLRSGFDLPTAFRTVHLRRIDRDRIEGAVATTDAVFERITVRSTSPSKQVVRSKSFEAADLATTMPVAGAGSYFTTTYSVLRDDGHLSTTPSTGRIAARGHRAVSEVALGWCAAVIDELASPTVATPSSFVRNFAQRLDLDRLPSGTRPIGLAIDTPMLTSELLGEDPDLRLVRTDPASGAWTRLDAGETAMALAAIEGSFDVRRSRRDHSIRRDALACGTVRMGRTRISLRDLDLPELGGIEVERTDVPVGEDDDRRPLSRYVDREDLFTVTFDDPELAYVGGELFRKRTIVDGGAAFLGHLLVCPALADTTTEKGGFEAGQIEFESGSVFRVVVDTIAERDDVLLCDDLGDEWADFIGCETEGRPPRISFYHGKHGALGLSASAFHEAVGQAQKNLGHMTLPSDAMTRKYAGWSSRYRSGDGVSTSISRVVRGGSIDEVRRRIDRMRTAPDAVRHVHVVTSSLSRAQVEETLATMAAGGRAPAHFVQLYWLLSTYFSACADMNAVGFVTCRP